MQLLQGGPQGGAEEQILVPRAQHGRLRRGELSADLVPEHRRASLEQLCRHMTRQGLEGRRGRGREGGPELGGRARLQQGGAPRALRQEAQHRAGRDRAARSSSSSCFACICESCAQLQGIRVGARQRAGKQGLVPIGALVAEALRPVVTLAPEVPAVRRQRKVRGGVHRQASADGQRQVAERSADNGDLIGKRPESKRHRTAPLLRHLVDDLRGLGAAAAGAARNRLRAAGVLCTRENEPGGGGRRRGGGRRQPSGGGRRSGGRLPDLVHQEGVRRPDCASFTSAGHGRHRSMCLGPGREQPPLAPEPGHGVLRGAAQGGASQAQGPCGGRRASANHQDFHRLHGLQEQQQLVSVRQQLSEHTDQLIEGVAVGTDLRLRRQLRAAKGQPKDGARQRPHLRADGGRRGLEGRKLCGVLSLLLGPQPQLQAGQVAGQVRLVRVENAKPVPRHEGHHIRQVVGGVEAKTVLADLRAVPALA
mmetsp:Transcript_51142/g.165569  ORF Transcript_51142/g.165569 Transcript_51142/m.165569 type:complete len:479 (+) Transcript_51142:3753-5189(+)